jgi:hypothetical protein
VHNRVEQRALHSARHFVAAAAREMVSDESGMLVRILQRRPEVVSDEMTRVSARSTLSGRSLDDEQPAGLLDTDEKARLSDESGDTDVKERLSDPQSSGLGARHSQTKV